LKVEEMENPMLSFSSLFQDKLRSYILACQDEETGGFADRPGDMVRLRKLSSRCTQYMESFKQLMQYLKGTSI